MNEQEKCAVGKLCFEHSCTVRVAENLYAQLYNAVSIYSILEIDCSAVEEADLSFVQLLLAAKESARRSGRAVRLAQPVSGALHDILRRGGFLTATNTDLAFWLPN